MRAMGIAARLIMLLLMAALVSPRAQASACKPADSSRPAIALVLSGGGARGAAHIGVLRVLEELQIPVDCIAGTSMGSIIGGYYAAGWSPDEIERELARTDWDQVFRGEPPRKALSFRRKQDELKYFNFEAGLRGFHLVLPRGATASPILDLLLRSKTLQVEGIRDFDQLPVPFRAVAADLTTGEAIILDHGELSRAIRASMSIPGLFPPVELDGRLLVDGGMVDNLPVDVGRAMGADVIIAVDVGTPLMGREKLGSLSDVALQGLGLAAQRQIDEQKKHADLLIAPELSRVEMLDFFAVGDAVRSGEAAARAAAASLSRYSNPEAFAAHLKRQRRAPPSGDVLRSVNVDGSPRVDARRVRARVHAVAGEKLDLDELNHDLGRIVQIGEFDRVDFDFVRAGDGAVDLSLHPRDNDWGPLYLRAGIDVTDDFEGHNAFNVLFNLTRTSLDALGAEWRNEFQIGRTRRVQSEWYQPLDFGGRWFSSTAGEYGLRVSDVFLDREKIAEYSVEYFYGDEELGIQLGEYGEARAGVRRGRAHARPTVGTPDLPSLDADVGGVTARFIVDRLDSAGVPREGNLLRVEFFRAETDLGSDFRYEKLDADWWIFTSLGRNTLFLALAGGTAFGGGIPAYDQFELGGLFSLSGYAEGELRGQYFGVARAGYMFQLLQPEKLFKSPIYVGGWGEVGNVWQQSREFGRDLVSAGTIALAADTRFGALYLAYGVADDGRGNFYIKFGQRF
ncbi:MAG TPA: patatin-like phospholipase family protein [Nevskiaceae bacterium]|nr:patatin-like phospholipase family protein [Nevskiaceae bacterium]